MYQSMHPCVHDSIPPNSPYTSPQLIPIHNLYPTFRMYTFVLLGKKLGILGRCCTTMFTIPTITYRFYYFSYCYNIYQFIPITLFYSTLFYNLSRISHLAIQQYNNVTASQHYNLLHSNIEIYQYSATSNTLLFSSLYLFLYYTIYFILFYCI